MSEFTTGIQPMTFQNTGRILQSLRFIEGVINQMLNPPHEEGSQP